MFAGHDTTAAAITWIIFLLGHRPDIIEDLQEEQAAILGEDSTDQEATAEDVGEMFKLEAVVKETMRLYPSLPFIARRVEQEFEVRM